MSHAGYDVVRVLLRLGLANWHDNDAHHTCSISLLLEGAVRRTPTLLVRVLVGPVDVVCISSRRPDTRNAAWARAARGCAAYW